MSKAQSGNVLFIVLVTIVVILVGGGAYYLGTKSAQPTTEVANSDLKMAGAETPTKPAYPAETQTNPVAVSDPYSEIPAGWTREKSDECSVTIPLPPNQEPYYIDQSKSANFGIDAGSWWHLNKQPYSNSQDKFFTSEILVSFQKPDQENDYIAGLVQIICGPNSKNYNTETFVKAYGEQFTDGTFSGLTFTKIGEIPIWGRSVAVASIEGGMYDNDTEYYFATPQKIFRVRKISKSTNQFIGQTTDLILKHLQFTN